MLIWIDRFVMLNNMDMYRFTKHHVFILKFYHLRWSKHLDSTCGPGQQFAWWCCWKAWNLTDGRYPTTSRYVWRNSKVFSRVPEYIYLNSCRILCKSMDSSFILFNLSSTSSSETSRRLLLNHPVTVLSSRGWVRCEKVRVFCCRCCIAYNLWFEEVAQIIDPDSKHLEWKFPRCAKQEHGRRQGLFFWTSGEPFLKKRIGCI